MGDREDLAEEGLKTPGGGPAAAMAEAAARSAGWRSRADSKDALTVSGSLAAPQRAVAVAATAARMAASLSAPDNKVEVSRGPWARRAGIVAVAVAAV
mmetsp:Transcript_72959/g.159514  ORF Transcript_72959/g.159514 Transcript_72959/m.159514 type:complete len:98 (+) Transcript_72959:133-426(+)